MKGPPLHVLLATHGYPPEIAAGTERVVERLARELRARGHRATVVTGSFEPRARVEEARRAQDGIPVRTIHRSDLFFDRWEKTYCPEASDAFARILAEERPDVVHAHQFIRLSRDLAHRATERRVPIVFTHHDFTTTCLIGFRAPAAGKSFCDLLPTYRDCAPCAGTIGPGVPMAPPEEFRALREDFRNELMLARACCAVSRAQREKLAKYHGLPEEHFEVVPLAPVHDLPRGTPAPEPPPLRVATWGMQMERKGAHVLVEAARLLGGALEVEIFGRFDDPNYERRCRELARGLPVRFHGRFEWEELAAMPLHLAVFPSLTFETFGLTFDEAWALGHPVVATDLGAYAERADASTRLFPAGDSAALAGLLRSLGSNPGDLARLRASVRPPAGFAAYVDAMETIYRHAVAAGAPPVEADAFDPARHPTAAEFAAREARLRDQLSGRP